MIELVVVISIIGIVLLFSFPVFRNLGLFSDAQGQVGDIARLVDDLKKRAKDKNMDFVLHMDSGSGRLWVTNETMDEEAEQAVKEKGVLLSDGIEILDVEFPGFKESGAREYLIRFSRQGYCDFALIHMNAGEKAVTLKIEPFLSRVQVLDTHVYLEDCI